MPRKWGVIEHRKAALKWYRDHQQYVNIYKRERNARLRLIILAHYAGGDPKCICCGESCVEFLTLDHINGNGSEHRKQVHPNRMHEWIVRNNFPEGFRVLCMNCNWSIGLRGYCPHQTRNLNTAKETEPVKTTPMDSRYKEMTKPDTFHLAEYLNS